MRFAFALPAALFAFTGVAAAAELPACAVGMPVNILACINYPGHIVAKDAAKGTWKGRCDSDKEESWVGADDPKRVCPAQDVAVSEKYFVGKWDLFIGGGAAYY